MIRRFVVKNSLRYIVLSTLIFSCILLVSFLSQSFAINTTNQMDPDNKYYGFCYSPFRSQQNPNLDKYPSRFQIKEDLQLIAQFTNCIRTYGTTDSLYDIPFVAKEVGLKCYVGIWLGRDKAKNEIEIKNVIKIANSKLDNILGIIIGNEVILRNDLTIDELSQYIKRVKAATNIPVGTADIYPSFYKNPSIVEDVDFILVHIHPYWEKIPANKAPTDVIKKYNDIKSKFSDKTVIIGETGYPSAGGKNGLAVPSATNQSSFFNEFVKLARKENVPYFYFDVFDEDWKKIEEGEAGNHWGLYDIHGELKPSLKNVLPTGFKRLPKTSDPIFPIVTNGKLVSEIGMGVDDSKSLRNWVSATENSIKINYPGGLAWGAVFLTIGGNPVSPPRPSLNFLNYTRLAIEMKGTTGKECVDIGVKDAQNPDDGSETKETVQLTTEWKVYEFKLSNFKTCRLNQIYVVTEFVFPYLDQNQAQTIEIKNITFLDASSPLPTISISPIPTSSPSPSPQPVPTLSLNHHKTVLENGQLFSGFKIGVDDSKHLRNWSITTPNSLKIKYPGGLAWGTVFLTVDDNKKETSRPSLDFSKYNRLTIEMKGSTGMECVDIGIKDVQNPDDGSEIKVPVHLTTEWKVYQFYLSDFYACQPNKIYVVTEFVFPSLYQNQAQTIEVKNITFHTADSPLPTMTDSSSANITGTPTPSELPFAGTVYSNPCLTGCMIFDNKNNTLITGNDDGNIIFWNVDDYQYKFTLNSQHGPIKSLDISTDDKLLAAACSFSIEIWDIDSRKIIRVIAQGEVNKIFFTKDRLTPFPNLSDRDFLWGWTYGKLQIWNLESGNEIIRTNEFAVQSMHGRDIIDFSKTYDSSPYGVPPVLLYGDTIGRLNVTKCSGIGISNKDFDIIKIIPTIPTGLDYACMGDSEIFATGDKNGAILLWKLLYFGYASPTAPKNLYIVLLKGLKKHTKTITGILFTDNANTLITTSEDGYIHFWDIKDFIKRDNSLYDELNSKGIPKISISQKASNIIQDVKKSYYFKTMVRTIAMSRDGKILSICAGDYLDGFQLYIWKYKTGAKPKELSSL